MPAVLMLTACGNQRTWYRDGSTEREFNMDRGQCRAQAFGVSGGNMLQMAMVINACMEGKGWELV